MFIKRNITVVPLLLVWLNASAVVASQPHVVRQFDLGKAHQARLTAVVYFNDWGPGTFGGFTIKFSARHRNGKLYQTVVPIEQDGILAKTPLLARDFVGLGRQQIFISTEMGGVGTLLLDYDGRRVRKLYANEAGRVWVSIRRNKSRQWQIIENWPRRQWEDKPDLGIGYDVGDNLIQRTLHWNGRKFIPDHAGPSTIRRRS